VQNSTNKWRGRHLTVKYYACYNAACTNTGRVKVDELNDLVSFIVAHRNDYFAEFFCTGQNSAVERGLMEEIRVSENELAGVMSTRKEYMSDDSLVFKPAELKGIFGKLSQQESTLRQQIGRLQDQLQRIMPDPTNIRAIGYWLLREIRVYRRDRLELWFTPDFVWRIPVKIDGGMQYHFYPLTDEEDSYLADDDHGFRRLVHQWAFDEIFPDDQPRQKFVASAL